GTTASDIKKKIEIFSTGASPLMKPPRVALVTGSGKKRIGRHVAAALAERGYNLVIHYHTSQSDALEAAAEFRQRGVDALALQGDLCDEAAVRGLFQTTLD